MRNPYWLASIRFCGRLALFLLPVILVFGLAEAVAWRSRELWPVSWVIRHQTQEEGDSLYGRGVLDQEIARYKYQQLLQQRPDVLVLGSSRMMQWRSELFAPSTSFYNAGGILHNLGDLLDLARHWPAGYQPDLVILGLDNYWFNSANEISRVWDIDLARSDSALSPISHLYAGRDILLDLTKDPGSAPDLLRDYWQRQDTFTGQAAYGFQAVRGNGFREDGSYQYGKYLQEIRASDRPVYVDREDPPIISRVRRGLGQFQKGGEFSQDRLRWLESVLRFFQDRDIAVVGVGMPFSGEVYQALIDEEESGTVYRPFGIEMKSLFTRYDALFFDYSSLATAGLDDLYMFDGFHSSEVAAAQVWRDILRQLPANLFPQQDATKNKVEMMLQWPGITPTELTNSL